MRDTQIGRDGRCVVGLVILGGLGVLALGSLAWGGYHALSGSADLMRRVDEVVLVQRGMNPYIDPDMTYPPTAPVVFVPLIAPLVDHPNALRAFWLGLNLAALAVLAGLILRNWGRGWSWALWVGFAAVLAASKPARLAIGMGQFALLPLALVFLADAAARRGRVALAGCCLAAALVKPTMALPFLVVFALRGRWRCLAFAAGVQGVALAVLCGWLGTGPGVLIREWLTVASGQRAAGLIDVPSLAARLGDGLAEAAGPITMAVLTAGSLVMVLCRRAPDRTLMAFAGFVAAIMAYHRPYDLVLLFPTLAVLVEAAWDRDARGLWRAVLAWAPAGLFAALLIAPAHPSVIAESTYNGFFIPAAYGFLGLLTWHLARQAGGAAESTLASWQDRADPHPGPLPMGEGVGKVRSGVTPIP